MQPGPFLAELDRSAATLTVSGEIDEGSFDSFREAITTAAQELGQRLVVNVSGVLYLPSAAIGVLVSAMQRGASSGTSIEVVAARGTIAQRVLEVCGLPYRTDPAT